MTIIVFSILALIVVMSIYTDLAMRIRLTKRQPSEDKLYWWRRGGTEMDCRYQELYPDSYLPLVRRYIFWFVIVVAFIVLIASRLKSN